MYHNSITVKIYLLLRPIPQERPPRLLIPVLSQKSGLPTFRRNTIQKYYLLNFGNGKELHCQHEWEETGWPHKGERSNTIEFVCINIKTFSEFYEVSTYYPLKICDMSL